MSKEDADISIAVERAMQNSSPGSSESDSALPVTSFTLPLRYTAPPISSPVPSRRGTPEPISTEGDLTFVRATCHCHRATMRVAFSTSSLPIPAYLCNCNSCRHNTGEMAFHTVKIVGQPMLLGSTAPFDVETTLRAYRPHDREGVTRYFCPVCGAHVLNHVNLPMSRNERYSHVDPPALRLAGLALSDRELQAAEIEASGETSSSSSSSSSEVWRVSGGALQQAEGVIQPVCHTHVSSTMDGGFAFQLRSINGYELYRYSEGIGSSLVPMGWRSPKLKTPDAADSLRLFCHCRSISLTVARPTGREARRPHAPYPDLLHPADTTRLSKLRNIRDEKWWIRPPLSDSEGESESTSESPERILAGHCVCRFCRLTSGHELQSWCYVVSTMVKDANRPPNAKFSLGEDEHRPAHLQQYVPSPGRYGEFCGVCGATIFWWSAGRPGILDLSVGLVDQDQDGVRAENFLGWTKDRVSFSESAKSPQFAAGLVQGLTSTDAQTHA